MSESIKVPVDITGIEAIDKLARAAEGAENNIEVLKAQLTQLGEQFKEFAPYADKIKQSLDKAFGDTATVSTARLNDNLANILKGLNALDRVRFTNLASNMQALERQVASLEKQTNSIVDRGLSGSRINAGPIIARMGDLEQNPALTPMQGHRLYNAFGRVADVSGMQEQQAAMEAQAQRAAAQMREMDRQFAAHSRSMDSVVNKVPSSRQSMQDKFDSSFVSRSQQAANDQIAMAEKVADGNIAAGYKWVQEALRQQQQVLKDAERAAEQRIKIAEREAEQEARLLEQWQHKAAMATAPDDKARLAIQRNQLLSGVKDPAARSGIGAAFDTVAEAESGGGGSLYRTMRGAVQTGMGLGVGNYQMYYLMNGLLNMKGGAALSGMALGGLGAGVLTLGSVVADAHMANESSERVRNYRNMAMEMGTSIQGARELQGVANITGVPIDAINSGMRQLTEGVEEPYGRGRGVATLLNQIGVNPRGDDGQVKDQVQLLKELSNSIKGMDDVQARDILERLFGKGGRNMLPLLRQDIDGIAKGIDNLNKGLDDPAALQYAANLSRLGNWWQSFEQSVSTGWMHMTNGAVSFYDSLGKIAGKSVENGMHGLFVNASLEAGPGNIRTPGYANSVLGKNAEQFKQQQAQKADIMAGSRIKTAALTDTSDKNNLQSMIQGDEKDVQNTRNALNNAVGEKATKEASANYNTSLAALEKHQQMLKSLNEGPEAAKSLQKQLDAARRGDLYGYDKIDQEGRDLNEQNPGHAGVIAQITAAKRVDYGAKLAAQGRRDSADISANGLRLESQYSKAARSGNTQISMLTGGLEGTTAGADLVYRENVTSRYSDYQDAQAHIRGLIAARDKDINPGDKDALLAANTAISKAQQDAQGALGTGVLEDHTRYVLEYAAAMHKAADETIRNNNALSEFNLKAAQTRETGAFSISEAYAQTGVSGKVGALERANRLAGARLSLTGGSAAGGNYRTAVEVANLHGAASADEIMRTMEFHRLLNQQSVTAAGESYSSDYNTRKAGGASDEELANLHLQYLEKIREIQLKNNEEVYSTEDALIKANAATQEELDNAAEARQKEHIQALKEQTEAVQSFTGGVFSAYMQARLERHSGSFPMRQELGRDFLSWGDTTFRNITGIGMNVLNGAGLTGDPLPWLTTAKMTHEDIHADPNDPNSPVVGSHVTTTHPLSLAGQALKGTPFGHRAAADKMADVPRHVETLDTNLGKMLELLGKWDTDGTTLSQNQSVAIGGGGSIPLPGGGVIAGPPAIMSRMPGGSGSYAAGSYASPGTPDISSGPVASLTQASNLGYDQVTGRPTLRSAVPYDDDGYDDNALPLMAPNSLYLSAAAAGGLGYGGSGKGSRTVAGTVASASSTGLIGGVGSAVSAIGAARSRKSGGGALGGVADIAQGAAGLMKMYNSRRRTKNPLRVAQQNVQTVPGTTDTSLYTADNDTEDYWSDYGDDDMQASVSGIDDGSSSYSSPPSVVGFGLQSAGSPAVSSFSSFDYTPAYSAMEAPSVSSVGNPAMGQAVTMPGNTGDIYTDISNLQYPASTSSSGIAQFGTESLTSLNSVNPAPVASTVPSYLQGASALGAKTAAAVNADQKNGTSSVGDDVAAGIGAGVAAAAAVTALPGQLAEVKSTRTGAGQVAGDTSSVLNDASAAANAIPGGQVVGGALQMAAMLAAGVSAIFGDPRKTRGLQLQNDAIQNQWTPDSAYNLVTSTNGQSVTNDITGAPRGYNGPLLAYPNSSSYTVGYDYTFNRNTGAPVPGGVQPVQSPILSVEINALDSKSVMDNAHLLTDAVHSAINDGHPVRTAISNIASPR